MFQVPTLATYYQTINHYFVQVKQDGFKCRHWLPTIKRFGLEVVPKVDKFQVPTLATYYQTFAGVFTNPGNNGFKCRHWLPTIKPQSPHTVGEQYVSSADIGYLLSNIFLGSGPGLFYRFKCRHWLPTIKHLFGKKLSNIDVSSADIGYLLSNLEI